MSPPRVRLAVLGDPLAYTLSPELHRAGCAALGLEAESSALRTPPATLGERLAELAAGGWTGANVTHPLKADVLRYAKSVSPGARRANSANTVGFAADGAWADSTDGPGFLDLLAELDIAPDTQRTVLLGAGGSARSLALALLDAGAPEVTVSARAPAKRRAAWGDLAARWVEWRSPEEAAALGSATLVVNCTPLIAADSPAPLDRVARGAAVLDLVYGPEPTPWTRAARAAGLAAWDGLGPLVHQARRSLALWFGREVPFEPLARAVGWPR